MRLDRNCRKDHRGKYALLNLRTNLIEWGEVGSVNEFFVIKLKDKHAPAALRAYAKSIRRRDPEFAREVLELARRALEHPARKEPD